MRDLLLVSPIGKVQHGYANHPPTALLALWTVRCPKSHAKLAKTDSTLAACTRYAEKYIAMF
jgi:hypothetical protein